MNEKQFFDTLCNGLLSSIFFLSMVGFALMLDGYAKVDTISLVSYSVGIVAPVLIHWIRVKGYLQARREAN